MRLYEAFYTAFQARENCANKSRSESANEWVSRWDDRIEELNALLPSGSGFDSGSRFLIDDSHAKKLTFESSYHHMNNEGFYTHWIEFQVVITPEFRTFKLKIVNKSLRRMDREDREYFEEVFAESLMQDFQRQ